VKRLSYKEQRDRETDRPRTLGLAVEYGDRHLGRYLFPIKAGAKFPPLIKNNLADASNDPEQLRAWEEKNPGCNWGVALRKSELMVGDVDTNPKKNKVGQLTYDDLDLMYGWPETEMTTTPSGGFHMIYECLPGQPHVMALGENGIGKDIDVPNYLLIPGCTLDDGTSYVGNGLEPAPCPQWIYDTIKSSKSKARITDAGEVVVELDQPAHVEWARDFLVNDAPPAIEGQGGEYITLKVGMALKDYGISPSLALDLMIECYNERCEPPWTRDDLAKKVDNAYTYASLSKTGGKTAVAEFGDVVEEPVTPMGIYDREKNVYVLDEKRVNTREKRDADRDVAAEVAAAGVEFEYGDRPEIDITSIASDLPKLSRKVQKIFVAVAAKPDAKPADQVFNREGELVHLSRNRLPPGTKDFDKNFHVDNELLLKNAEPEWFADTLERKLQFYKMGKKKGDNGRSEPKPVPTGAPSKLVNRMFAISQDWRYPKIKGTVETPTLRADGTILDTPGYDKKSGLYFDPGTMTFPPIAKYPTMAQRVAALDILKEIYSDFPFADDDDIKDLSLSVALSMPLTGIIRRSLPTAPMFGVDATQANTGKTELSQVAAIIMTGRETAVRNFPTDEHQCKAELAAAFEAGDAMILYDNIDGDKQTVESAALCAALTSEKIQARRYGSNSGEDQIKALTNSLMACTGNGLTFEGDMTDDRGLKISLRTDLKLAQRTFRHWPLSDYLIKRRPALVAACLTILRGHIVDKNAKVGGNFRFPEWRAMVADALVGLGLPDPTLACARFKVGDPRQQAQREVMRAWARYIGEADVMTTTALPSVRQAIADARGLPDAKRLSVKSAVTYLNGMINVPLLGYRLTKWTDAHTKAIHWQAKCIDAGSRIEVESPPTAAETERDFGFADAVDEFNDLM
jgi:hypothetical protein